VLDVLGDAGALYRGRIPAAWQRLCGVDREGNRVDRMPKFS
jgi:hypothetical protein